MKKMLLATALALLITGCSSTDVYCSKQTGSSSTKGNHHYHFFVSESGRRKLSMQPKFVAAQKMLLKQETQQTFVNGLLGFITLGIYTPLELHVCAHNNCMSCPSIWATLSALLINILLGSFQLFLHSDQPLSEGEIIRSAVSASRGRLHYPRRRRWWLHALTDRLLDVQPTTTSGNIITQSIIFSFSIS